MEDNWKYINIEPPENCLDVFVYDNGSIRVDSVIHANDGLRLNSNCCHVTNQLWQQIFYPEAPEL